MPAVSVTDLRKTYLARGKTPAVEAVRGWRVGYEKSGGKVVKAPLDELWREMVGRPAA